MDVLIVEDEGPLAQLWADHMSRAGANVTLAYTQSDAEEILRVCDFPVVVLNLRLSAGDASAIADYASFRRPRTKVVFVTSSSFFSDGSIFHYMPNACAMVPDTTPPADLAALVEYHGRESVPA
ncbi:response regulator receiver domain-containing protein [Litoreibacter ponti]|uniref:Response regulator receiver domain-containing protein n=1 Tax=Litoreibacter ponti TaxID=1510457 RepID=A0A2T6BN44_9RHOB|nr:response regulator [Litoreibacter ponti]PTX57510.1 response regulator receiver domain-containing protein [Litoreibacter ponti]